MNDLQRAREQYSLGNFKTAITFFEKALITSPGDPDIFSERGVCFFHMKEFAKALLDFNEAVRLEPNHPYRYSSRAYIRDAMGDIDGAILDYEKAIHLDPEDLIAHNNLGLLLEKKGRMKSAKRHFEKVDNSTILPEQEHLIEKAETKISKNQKLPLGEAFGVIKNTFRSKKNLKEFIDFVKNGFRIK
ncbi:MAG: tetratricopeptide repeat protein [Flavobacteriales bacterium]|nr:tetratricopeptide repeat protein [Flavobacteriales bacterium]